MSCKLSIFAEKLHSYQMAKIGYIMTAPGYNDYEADVKKQIANIHLTHPECRQHRTDARTYKRSARGDSHYNKDLNKRIR